MTDTAFSDLCNACRVGDIELVEILLSTPNLDINQVDEWDYLPLILLSLCGHLEIVKLLLLRGAVCDRDTFEGARCIYGALNDTIRKILMEFDVSKAVDMTQPFAAHISKILGMRKDVVFEFEKIVETRDQELTNGSRNQGLTSGSKDLSMTNGSKDLSMTNASKDLSMTNDSRDLNLGNVNLSLDGKLLGSHDDLPTNQNQSVLISLNRFLLSVRSPYFKDKFTTTWRNKNIINMPNTADPAVFKLVVDFVYLRTDSIPMEESLLPYARKLQWPDLAECVNVLREQLVKQASKLRRDFTMRFVERARDDLKALLSKIITDSVSVAMPQEYNEFDLESPLSSDLKARLVESECIPDAIVAVEDMESECLVYYPVHKSILVRSEYFDTMFKSELFAANTVSPPMLDGHGDTIDWCRFGVEHVPVLRICNSVTSKAVAELVLAFLYHDDLEDIPMDLTVELLFAADELFLDKLKSLCAVNVSGKFLRLDWGEFCEVELHTGYNCFDLVRASWQTRCDKLEQHVTKMIAYSLRNVSKYEREKMMKLVGESAARIQERQTTDTIELVDDMRYFLSRKYAVDDEVSKDFEPMSLGDTREYGDVGVMERAMAQYEADIAVIDEMLEEMELEA